MPRTGGTHLGLAMVGHAHSGKTTLTGRLAVELGTAISYRLSALKEERARGNTIMWHAYEMKTDSYHYTLIDLPGSKKFIKNMIRGASQADIAVLVVPANAGDFEASIAKADHKNGQVQGEARQHALLCKIMGIEQLIVCINKMDHDTVKYSEERYNEIRIAVSKMLTKLGYLTVRIPFIPISAKHGDNIMQTSAANMPWWKGFEVKIKPGTAAGHTLYDALQFVPRPTKLKRREDLIFRMPISGVHNMNADGVVVTGRIEQGKISCGVKVKFALSGCSGDVAEIEMHRQPIESAKCGDIIGVHVSNPGQNDTLPRIGDVMYIANEEMLVAPRAVSKFTALLFVQDHPGQLRSGKLIKNRKTRQMQYKCGYTPCIYARTGKAQCQMIKINWKMGRSTSNRKFDNPWPAHLETRDQAEVVFEPKTPLFVTTFDRCKPFGRLAMMDSNSLTMLGKVTQVTYV